MQKPWSEPGLDSWIVGYLDRRCRRVRAHAHAHVCERNGVGKMV